MNRFVPMLAVVALVATMSPITPADAVADVTVHFVNAEGVPIDVWVDALVKVQNLATGAGVDVTVDAGASDIVVCNVLSQATPSTVAGCNQTAGTLPVLNPVNQGFDFVGGSNNTLVFGAGGDTFGFINDLSQTATGNARFSLNNASGVALNVCIDGVQVLTAVPSVPAGTTLAPGSEIEIPAGQAQSVRIGVLQLCTDAGPFNLDLAAGTNTVVTTTAVGGACAAGCVQVLNVTPPTLDTPGGTVTFAPSSGTITDLTNEPIPVSPPLPSGATFPYGLIGFTITGIELGATVSVTLTFPNPVSEYWKLQNGAWTQISATSSGTELTFTLVDGGVGDADGEENRAIVDPGAPGTRVAPGTPSTPGTGSTLGTAASRQATAGAAVPLVLTPRFTG